MKKLNRFGVLLGLLAGAGIVSFVPLSQAQEADEPGPATEVMESLDLSLNPPSPPGIPEFNMPLGGPDGGPSFGPMSMPGPMPGMPGPDPEDMLAFHGGGDVMMLRAGVQSSFSDDQLEKMYKAKTDFMDKAGPKMAELKSQERALRDLLTQPEFEKSKAMSLQSKINGLKDELANLKLEQRISLLNTLTAEQRKELRRSYVKCMDFGMMGMRMRGRMGHHGRMGKRGRGGCPPGKSCPSGGGGGGDKHEAKESGEKS